MGTRERRRNVYPASQPALRKSNVTRTKDSSPYPATPGRGTGGSSHARLSRSGKQAGGTGNGKDPHFSGSGTGTGPKCDAGAGIQGSMGVSRLWEPHAHPFFYCFALGPCFTDTTVWERLQRLAVWRLGGFPFYWDFLSLGWCAAQGGGDAGMAGAWCFLGPGSRLSPVGSARWPAAVTVRLRSASSAEVQARRTGSPPARRSLTGRDGTTSWAGNCTCNLSILRTNVDTLVCTRFINTRGRFDLQ